MCDENLAPKPSDPVLSPPAKRKSDASDGVRDAELAAVLSKTEIMILNFHQNGKLSQRRGQALLSMVKHPEFKPEDLQSQTIVHLIRRLERPFQQSQMNTYNLWKEGDGDQKLELVVRDYLEVFREIMRDPRWKGLFDLLFRAIFDDLGNRLVGPACSALAWERIQTIMGSLVPIGFSQLYFDATFMGQNFGIESGYVSSLNLRSNAKFQHGSVKMLALLPNYNKDAASKCLSPQQIKKREIEVHQACIGVIVRDLNKYSNVGGEVEVLCPDGKVYPMLIIMLCLALDHEATEKHCLKAANGCLSCSCPEDEFASVSSEARLPTLVESVIMKIEEAAAKFLEDDGSIKQGCIGSVAAWEKENRIKLYWNNWFDVSFTL